VIVRAASCGRARRGAAHVLSISRRLMRGGHSPVRAVVAHTGRTRKRLLRHGQRIDRTGSIDSFAKVRHQIVVSADQRH
jgi:hypothetical protein